MPWAAILLFIWQNRELLLKLLPVIIEIWRALKGKPSEELMAAMQEAVATEDTTPITRLRERLSARP
jgi:phage-related baseplate assembly protein